MTRRVWLHRILAVAGVLTLGGIGWATASSDRPDCPGKIVCPLTGQLICKDQCPARDASRPDCPGQIICPLTGKLVCKDRCPANGNSTYIADRATTPPCCRKGT